MTTSALRAAMRKRFAMPEWVLMEEVRNAAGHSANRSADGIAMNTWPSRGLEIHGLEVKASRSDWLREVKDPAKADAIAVYCDRWSIVAMPGIVKLDELPITWGLFELSRDTLREVKTAPQNADVKPLSKTFVAAMMRRAGEIGEKLIREKIHDELTLARRQDQEQQARNIAMSTQAHRELQAKLDKVKEATGIDITSWHSPPEKLIPAIKFALGTHDLTAGYSGLDMLKRQLGMMIKNIDECLPVLPQRDAEAS